MNKDTLRDWLIERVASLSGLPVSEISGDLPFAAIGITSRKLLELVEELSHHLARELDPLLVYDHPSIDQVCMYLSDGQERVGAEPVSGTIAPEDRDIAIVGLACRFPGAASPQKFWEDLLTGQDRVGPLPENRPDRASFVRHCEASSMNTPISGGFVDGIELFDNAFFRISPNEARVMDPQQRLLLLLAWEALADAGIDPAQLSGRNVGVFVGVSQADYRLDLDEPGDGGALAAPGNSLSICANRISYHFNFRGPSVAADTACSSSLVAVKLAIDSLRRGECEIALVAGANLLLDGRTQSTLHRAGMLSPDYRCASFDAAANGYVRSEGVGLIVLQPIAAAREQRGQIYATIKGAAVNQDGRSNGLTAPVPQAQVDVIQLACNDAGIDPGKVSFVEAHGTGTPLGDPIEMGALSQAYCRHRDPAEPLYVGSVKSNIGHLEAAAGIAGLMKAALALHHGKVPANLHFDQINPRIDIETLKVRVIAATFELDPALSSWTAGVSSFGFGGTNCHILLESAPRVANQAVDSPPVPVPVRITAKSKAALEDGLVRWEEFASSSPEAIVDIAYSATTRRPVHDWQTVFLANSSADLARQIKARHNRREIQVPAAAPPRSCFVFTGQGEHWKEAAEWMPYASPLFGSMLRRCDELACAAGLDFSIVEALARDGAIFDDPGRAQPCIVALQIAMLAEARRFGLEPTLAIGHSVGEISAAVACGMLGIDEAMRLVVRRAEAIVAAPSGGAIAVALPADRALAQAFELGLELAVAAVNAADSVVLSGPLEAVEAFDAQMRASGTMTHWVSRRAGFHSPLMNEAARQLAESLGTVATRQEQAILLSSTLGHAVTGEDLDANYWSKNLCQTVRFSDALKARPATDDAEVFIEISPRSVLSGLVRRAERAAAVTLFDSAVAPSARFMAGLVRLAELGVPVEWGAAIPRTARLTTLPPPTWDLQAFWKRPSSSQNARSNSLLGSQVLRRGESMTAWASEIDTIGFPTLADHAVGQHSVLPAAAILTMMADAIGSRAKDSNIALEGAEFSKPILLSNEGIRLQTILERHGDKLAIELSASAGGGDGVVFATAVAAEGVELGAVDLDASLTRCPQELSGLDLYARISASKMNYGSTFTLVEKIYLGKDEAFAKLRPSVGAKLNHWGPDFRQIDAAMHPLLAILASRDGLAMSANRAVPVSLDRMEISRQSLDAHWAHISLRDISSDRVVIDFALSDDAGQVLAEIKGMALVLGHQATAELAITQNGVNAYQSTWLEDDKTTLAAVPDLQLPIVVIAPSAQGVAEAVATRIREHGGRCFIALEQPAGAQGVDILSYESRDTEKLLRQLHHNGFGTLSAIIDLRYLDPELSKWDAVKIRDAADAARTSLTAASLAPNAPGRILFVTPRGSTLDQLTIAPEAAPIWGMARCFPFENPMAICQCLLVDPAESNQALGDAIFAELALNSDMEIARANGRRYLRRLLPMQQRLQTQQFDLNEGTCLVTGATGGLAPAILAWLTAQNAKHLVCIGRKPESAAVAEHYNSLRAQGIELCYIQADVADLTQLETALAQVDASMPPIRAIVHAAGYLEDGPLLSNRSEAFHRVTRPKIDGIRNLLTAVPADALRFVMLFSSAAGTIGSPGQGAYAAANAFLDALAVDSEANRVQMCSIGWGPWREVGMAAQGGRVVEELSAGLNFLSEEQGHKVMSAMIGGNVRHGLALGFDLKNLIQFYPQGPGFSLFSSLFNDGDVILRSFGDAAVLNHRNNVAADFVAPRTAIEQLLAGIWQRSLGVERVGIHDSFFDLGGDSVFGNQIILEIGNKTGIMLKPEQVFEHFTIAGLAVLVEQVLADRIDAMSENEAEQLLAKLGAM